MLGGLLVEGRPPYFYLFHIGYHQFFSPSLLSTSICFLLQISFPWAIKSAADYILKYCFQNLDNKALKSSNFFLRFLFFSIRSKLGSYIGFEDSLSLSSFILPLLFNTKVSVSHWKEWKENAKESLFIVHQLFWTDLLRAISYLC